MRDILLLLAFSFAFTSCNKTHCWRCKMFTSYQSDPNASPTQDTSYKICDLTKDGIQQYEQEVRLDSGFVTPQGAPDTLMRRTYCDKERTNFFQSDIWPHF